ncbi:MAG: RodZ domain-containing protein [Spirochaetales bacterium]
MAKIGSKIQETRLRKGLTLDRIADDTNISVRFLSKIENDDFTGFPGEPYIVGFIRNYAEYLGLDPEATVASYRSKDDEVPAAPAPAVAAAADAAAARAGSEADAAPAVASESIQERVPESSLPAAAEPEAKTGSDESGKAAPKPRKSRKPKSTAPANAHENAPAPPFPAPEPSDRKKEKAGKAEPIPEPKPFSGRRILSTPALRSTIIAVLAIAIVGLALFWIVAGGKSSYPNQNPGKKEPTEYRVEGGPFETRLYVGDSLLIPIGNDVYKIRLASINDTVNLDTPFGQLQLPLGGSGALDPDKNGSPDASLVVGDFEKNKPASGALLKVEFAPAETATGLPGEITILGTASGAPASAPAASAVADSVIMKSTRGPYPFVVQVTFRGNCLFRYEVDRKEWVEKYYSKGESLTINVTNTLTVWTSNAQAVKLSFQASGGKTADLEIGAPGEIAVKRVSWARAEGSWALISSNLD